MRSDQQATIAPSASTYAWLEDLASPAVQAFLADHSERTEQFLSGLSRRARFRSQVEALLKRPRFDRVGRVDGDIYAIEHSWDRTGVLVRAPSVEGLEVANQLVLDSAAAGVATGSLLEWVADRQGTQLACIVAPRGSMIYRVVVVNHVSGAITETLSGVRGTSVVWTNDGRYLLYLRHAGDATHPGAERTLWQHEIGTPQANDVAVHRWPDEPGSLGYVRLLGGDGRWAVMAKDEGPKSPNAVVAVSIGEFPVVVRPLVASLLGHHRLIGVDAGTVYLITDGAASRNRVLAVDVASGWWREVVAERDDEMLLHGVLARGCLALKYSRPGSQFVDVVDLSTPRIERLPLGDYVSVPYIGASAESPEVFLVHSTLASPPVVKALDVRNSVGTSAHSHADAPKQLRYERIEAESADGTVVPLLVAHRDDGHAGPRATLLYAYGGFGVALRPGFSPLFAPWLELGGSVVIAHVRGGGELGTDWHRAAVRRHRHRSFEDLYAVAERLVELGCTTASRLVLHGRSNGGLLAAVAMLQRPDLWAAVIPAAGIYDMLRFHHFLVGRTWLQEYGDPEDPEDAGYLAGYSPLHNVRAGSRYPPVLIVVGGQDERVAASHSYKLVAALDDAAGDRSAPTLLLADANTGHGLGASTRELAKEYGDELAFAAHFAELA